MRRKLLEHTSHTNTHILTNHTYPLKVAPGPDADPDTDNTTNATNHNHTNASSQEQHKLEVIHVHVARHFNCKPYTIHHLKSQLQIITTLDMWSVWTMQITVKWGKFFITQKPKNMLRNERLCAVNNSKYKCLFKLSYFNFWTYICINEVKKYRVNQKLLTSSLHSSWTCKPFLLQLVILLH